MVFFIAIRLNRWLYNPKKMFNVDWIFANFEVVSFCFACTDAFSWFPV